MLYNADEWRDRVHLMNRYFFALFVCHFLEHKLKHTHTNKNRDCNQQQIGNPMDAVKQGNATYLPDGTQSKDQFSISHTVETTSENAPAMKGASVVVMKWDSFTGGCVQASQARTLMGKEVYQTASKKNVYRSILLPGQPFAYAGDVTLTAVQLNDGKYAVAVDRLYGSEANEFSMINVLREFPAHPPAGSRCSLFYFCICFVACVI